MALEQTLQLIIINPRNKEGTCSVRTFVTLALCGKSKVSIRGFLGIYYLPQRVYLPLSCKNKLPSSD